MCNLIKLNTNKDIKSYCLGFLLSLILTIFPFLLIMNHILSNKISYVICLICAVIQIFVHFVYFLHLNLSQEKKWNLITLLFVMIIIFIVIFGSIWIMSHLNHHMYYYNN